MIHCHDFVHLFMLDAAVGPLAAVICRNDARRLVGVTNRPAPPALDVSSLRLGTVGLPWVRLDVVDETGSTNADLLARSAAGTNIDGSVLVAEYQRAGRGRHGRQWSAAPRTQIALSVGVDAANVPTDAWGWLPLATGVAVVDVMSELCGIAVGLKWPNDVMAGGGKLAGILAEVASPRPVIVVGLGLNVTLTAEEAPDPFATSLLMLGSSVIDRNVLLRAILRALADRIGSWRAAKGADDTLAADYRRHSLTLDTRVRASLPGDRTIEGVADAVDELGRLRIDTGEQVVTVSAGDITHLRPVNP
jgi:BirA family transcriptional regulator, biotin operon repressor / biotin---[acetyl-CoA-carboxylase] ligase